MKKILTITLAMLLIASSFAVSFAVESQTTQVAINVQKIAFGDIETLMLKNSGTMTMAKNALDKADYDYRQAVKSINTLDTQYKAIDLSTSTGWSSASSLSSQLVSLRTTRDTLKYSLDNAKINYEKQVKSNVTSVQQQYIATLAAANNAKISDNNLAISERQLNVMAARLKLGFVSRNQYATLNNQVSDARISNIQVEDQSKILVEKLGNALGLSTSSAIELSPIATFDFSVIDKLVYSDDLTKVMENSVSIKDAINNLASMNNTSKRGYDTSKYQYSVKDLEILLAQTKTSTQEGFKDQYTALKTSYASYLIAIRDFADKRIDLKNAEARYKIGMVSLNEVSNLRTEIANLELKNSNSHDSLYLSYLQYEAKKLGY
jgi:outer membrane protein TolC